MKTLVAYDADGNVVATLDVIVERNPSPRLIDFDAHERAGRKLRELWDVEGAVRSETTEPT